MARPKTNTSFNRIRVHLLDMQREHIYMRYLCPDTGRQVSRSTRTNDPELAEIRRKNWEKSFANQWFLPEEFFGFTLEPHADWCARECEPHSKLIFQMGELEYRVNVCECQRDRERDSFAIARHAMERLGHELVFVSNWRGVFTNEFKHKWQSALKQIAIHEVHGPNSGLWVWRWDLARLEREFIEDNACHVCGVRASQLMEAVLWTRFMAGRLCPDCEKTVTNRYLKKFYKDQKEALCLAASKRALGLCRKALNEGNLDALRLQRRELKRAINSADS